MDLDTELNRRQKELKYEDFEVIKQLGEGNFTKIFQVQHVKYPGRFYAMKVCSQLKVSQLRKETDILMEKHSLNKILEHHKKLGLPMEELPSVKIIGTFKDVSNLYFLTEML